MSDTLSSVTESATTDAQAASGGLVSTVLTALDNNRDRSPIIAFLADNAQKLFKYVVVAVVGVPVGLLVYTIFLLVFPDLARWKSNALATLVMVLPNYLMNRYWVWGKNDTNRFWGEVFPFGVMAFVGLAASTLATWALVPQDSHILFALFIQVVAFGLVWIAKFFVLDKVLFGRG